MDTYEIMFIITNNIEDATNKKEAENLQKIITSDKGKIIDFKEIGKRKLAYPIKKEVTGTYYLLIVEAKHSTIKEFNRKVSINENVLRHLIIKKEGE
ncbi:MAG: 30S ribosomal protein S6 [Mollicutes bacterium]|nr:30S ribosomal protein S6 [Mollicutes bacterium]